MGQLMKTILLLSVLFILFFFSIITAQNVNKNCPSYYTHAKIIESEIRIIIVEVKNSGNYSSLPDFTSDLDSISKLIVYPDIAKRAEIECTLKLILTIDSTGNVMNTNVPKGCGAGLEEAALKVLVKERFLPAMKDNEVVASEIVVDIIFNLNVYIDKPDLVLEEIKYELSANIPYHKKTIVFRSDGTAYLEEDRGYEGSKKHISGKIYPAFYSKLNDFIISQCFFDYENEYINQSPSDFPIIKVTVQNDNITKSVAIKGESHDPVGFWAISSLILYVADQIKWEEVKE